MRARKTEGFCGKFVNGKLMAKLNYSIGTEGYPRLNSVRIHRLLACVENDPQKVFADDEYVVHHKNGIKWDNRLENVELLSREEHRERHYEDRHEEKPFHDPDVLEWLYHSLDKSSYEIAEMYGVTSAAIRYWLDCHNIESKPTSNEKLSDYDVENLYHGEELTQTEIADKVGVATRQVHEYMKDNGIETRNGNPFSIKGEDHVQYIEPEKMLSDLRSVYDKIGKWPSVSEYEKHGSYSTTSVYKKFDSWEDFKQQASN